jgi:succinate dehydrogenase/fumarate reductase-like Fe-S protein
MPHILHVRECTEPTIGDPVTAEVFRYDPSRDPGPRMQHYVVPYRHSMSVFTMLREIYEHLDPTLAFRTQHCGIGICGTCHLRIGSEGKAVNSCKTMLKPGDHVIVKPYNEKKVIRDLVVDL